MTSANEVDRFLDDNDEDGAEITAPGNLTYENLILRRAVSRSKDLYLWRQKIVIGKMEKRQVDLFQLPVAGAKPVNHWTFHDCWPCRWSGPSFNAREGDMAFEEVELCYDRFEWV